MTLRNEEELSAREEEYQEQVKEWGLDDLADFLHAHLYRDECQSVGTRCPGMMVRQYGTTTWICDVCGKDDYKRDLEMEHEEKLQWDEEAEEQYRRWSETK